ncbi:MAG: NAD(P)-binding domain-containing protein, partial [Burkholderiales bacterium]
MSTAFAPPERIGFIGLGMMGVPMARNLARAGYQLAVLDANPDAVKRFVAETPSATPTARKALGEQCRIVITMVPDSKIVREILI